MSDKKAWEDRIDSALEAWPAVKAADEPALAEKTLNRIRANFPPKSKLTLTDDALVTSPFPQAAEDQTRDSSDDWQDASRDATFSEDEQTPQSLPAVAAVAGPNTGGPDATLETAIHPLADVTQEIRPEKNQRLREKSSQIDVPMSRSSSIPPPSSGVSRSSANQQVGQKVAAPSEPKQKKVEERMGQVERQRDRTSFKDLAKLAATPPPPSTKPSSAKVPVATPSSSALKGDSGVVDLQAAALSDPQGAERAKSTPLASGSLFDEEGPASGRPSGSPPSMSGEHLSSGPISAAHSVPQQIDPYSPASVRPSAPPASLSAGRISAVPMSAGPHSAVAAMQQPAKKEGKSRVGVILLSFVGVAAIAAGGFFYVHTHHAAAVAAADVKSVQAPVAATQPAATQPVQNGVAVAQNDQPAVPDTVSADDPAVAQNAIPGVKSAGKPVAHAAKGKPSIMKDSTAKTEVDTPTAPPPVVPDTKAATKDEAPPPVGGSANLQNAMQTAAGPSDSTSTQSAATGPKFAPGSVPQRPSQGALASAIGRVLPDARSCLGPDDGVSYANIVFESGGSVQNVTLSGYAANKPAGACITTALKKGQVGPFAEPTYSAKVTVRP